MKKNLYQVFVIFLMTVICCYAMSIIAEARLYPTPQPQHLECPQIPEPPQGANIVELNPIQVTKDTPINDKDLIIFGYPKDQLQGEEMRFFTNKGELTIFQE